MANLSLKNIPDDLYAQLRASAEENRRSINGEIIYMLERSLRPTRRDVAQRLESAAKLRQSLAPRVFDPADIDTFKRQGRD